MSYRELKIGSILWLSFLVCLSFLILFFYLYLFEVVLESNFHFVLSETPGYALAHIILSMIGGCTVLMGSLMSQKMELEHPRSEPVAEEKVVCNDDKTAEKIDDAKKD